MSGTTVIHLQNAPMGKEELCDYGGHRGCNGRERNCPIDNWKKQINQHPEV